MNKRYKKLVKTINEIDPEQHNLGFQNYCSLVYNDDINEIECGRCPFYQKLKLDSTERDFIKGYVSICGWQVLKHVAFKIRNAENIGYSVE